jgi:membrane fusion protein (multidrug efflux system)
MLRKPYVAILALVGMAGLAWVGWQAQRQSASPVAVVGPKSGSEKAEGGADAKSEGKGDGKAEGRADAKSEGKGDAKSEGKGDGKSEGKGDGKSEGKGGPPGKGGPRGPALVEAAAVQGRDLVDAASAVGTLRANETVMLRSEVPGRIAALAFRDGDRVSAGQVILRLDASLPEAELAQAKAELALGQNNYQRTQDLASRNFVSASALDQADANLRVLEAKHQLAKARLDRTVIRAPFTGYLGLRNVSVGDYVKEGADLVLLEDVGSLKVDLRLPERFIGQLRKGQPINVAIDAYPGRKFPAKVEAIDVQVDSNGRFVLVRGLMANPQLSLRSGMFARASLVLSERKGAVLVPEEAVTPIGADLFVWVAEDGKTRRVKVEPGLRTEGLAEVRGDLKPGDLVVTAGQQRLMRDGQEVKVQGAGGPPAAKGGSSGPPGDKGAPRSPPGAPPEGKGPPGGAREGAAGK